MNTADKIKVMQVYDEWEKEGCEQPAIIEKRCRWNAHKRWEDVDYEPVWNWKDFEYRVKQSL